MLTSCTRVVLHLSCKTFPSPGRVHGNPGRVCKKKFLTQAKGSDFLTWFARKLYLYGFSNMCIPSLNDDIELIFEICRLIFIENFHTS